MVDQYKGVPWGLANPNAIAIHQAFFSWHGTEAQAGKKVVI